MDGQASGRSHTIIVRLWAEPAPDAADRPAGWRGEATHVPSGNAAFFDGLDGLRDVIETLLRRAGDRP